ncbi:MAG TPA: ABC transporter ATP-binding protein, partial [Firmicutes bacterium]|nr:ABC transporter ATP-binding protein [Bacillota bacterium]
MVSNNEELVIENLDKTYYLRERRINALERINLQVKTGEFINIIGPSGCGKS